MVSISKINTAKLLLFLFVMLLCYEMRSSSVEFTSIQTPLRADAFDYYAYAVNLVKNQQYVRMLSNQPLVSAKPDFLRPPGYPMFAAMFYTEDTANFYFNTAYGQLLLSVLAGLILFFVSWKTSNYWFGLAITLVYATSPHIINMNLYFLTESLMTSLLILIMLSIYLVITINKTWAWVLAGFLLAYASLTRPYIKYFILLLGPYLYHATNRQSLKGVLSMVLIFGCVYGPWVAATSMMDGTNQKGLMVNTIHHGLYPNLEYNNDPKTKGYPYRFDPASTEISKNLASVTDELIRRFKTQPIKHLRWFILGKPLTLWQWSTIQGADEIFIYNVESSPWNYLPHFKYSLKLQKTIHYPMVLTAFIFCIVVWFPFFNRIISDHKKLILIRGISLALIYGTLIHLIGAPFPRYQIPQKPLMFFMSFMAIWTVMQYFKSSNNYNKHPI